VTVLLITDPNWYDRHSKGTHGLKKFGRFWEFLGRKELQEKNLPSFWGSTVWDSAKGDRSGELLSLVGAITPTTFVVPGAITLLLGLDFAKRFFTDER
jgi:hypothetical protein